MALYKVLGQANPVTTGTLTSLYSVPAATHAFCSTLSICNQGAIATLVRVSVQPNGQSIESKHYIVYDHTIQPNDSLFLTIGIALDEADEVNVQASTTSVSFSLFGSTI